MDVLVGSPASVLFDLQGPTGSLPPDNSSASYVVYAQDGSVLVASTPISTTTSMTTLPVVVAGGSNTIATGLNFEHRSVLLAWTSGGQSYSLRRSYRIIPFLNFTARRSDVRSVLGLSDDELEDDDIDLVNAYFSVGGDATLVTLDAALKSGTALEIAANQAIVYQAAYDCIPSVKTRILQSAADGVQKVTRFTALPDLDALAQDMRARRAVALSIITGIPILAPTLMVLTTPMDVIRGDPWRRINVLYPESW